MKCPSCGSIKLKRGELNLWCTKCGFFPIKFNAQERRRAREEGVRGMPTVDKECTTHYACDCIQKRITELEQQLDAERLEYQANLATPVWPTRP